MVTTWDWSGARWWKFDFHTHTPKSDDYAAKALSAQDWVLNYMRAGLDCVAITDHNSGEWIDELKKAEAALAEEKHAEYRKLYLFPGVELSVNGGFHVLAILDSFKTSHDIAGLIGACGYHGTPGTSDAVTEKSFVQVVDEIVKLGGIAIPAHVDQPSGLFKLQGNTLEQAVRCEHVFAMEVVNPNVGKPQIYTNAKLSWTEVLGSDAHHPSGSTGQQYPGSRFTWVKMGTPSIEGLRLALLDGPLSVSRSDATTGNPNDHAEMVIESVEISKARYMGRKKPYELRLNPWMNAVIGGRGTGKSTLVEFLRLVLRREEELEALTDVVLKSDFEKYKTVDADRGESGLLTQDAEIRVVYRKGGVSYRIQWSPSGLLDPIQRQTANGWVRDEGDIRQRFPVRMYSQKQVFQLASTPLALLHIINDAPELDYASWKKSLNAQESQYLSLRAKIREIETGLAEESRLKGELEDVKRKLVVFEQSGHADILKTLQKRRRQLQAVEAWEERLGNGGHRLREMAEEISPETLDDATFDRAETEDARLLELARDVHESIGKIAGQIKELARQSDTVLVEWRGKKDGSSWKAAVDTATGDYESLLKRLTDEGVADPSGYGLLVQRRQVIEKQLGELEERKKQSVILKIQADGVLECVAVLRQAITRKRGEFLDKVLKDNRYVRISVVPYGSKETVETELRRLIQRDSGGFEKDIGRPEPDGEGLLGKIYKNNPTDAELEKRLVALKHNLREIACNPQQADVSDRRFAVHVSKLSPETLDRLDLWFPDDSLKIEYSTSADQGVFRPIHEGSPGQKTAALLAFLLSYGEEPLILDQPEDDLDNHLIYDLIVTQLRDVKRRRQVIVVTHNANIVVNGDAEYVVALTARGRQSQVEADGSLQDKAVRQTICNVMEGGEKAFEQRYRRIALEGRHVR